MSRSKRLSAVGAVAAVIVLLIATAWIALWWVGKDQAETKQTLASGYDSHSLFAPFTLASKSWQPSGGLFANSGTWTYRYTAAVMPSTALAAAQKQLSDGGYQVVATSPDVITSSSATLHRDLITGDDSIEVQLDLAATPVTAEVTVIPLEGS